MTNLSEDHANSPGRIQSLFRTSRNPAQAEIAIVGRNQNKAPCEGKRLFAEFSEPAVAQHRRNDNDAEAEQAEEGDVTILVPAAAHRQCNERGRQYQPQDGKMERTFFHDAGAENWDEDQRSGREQAMHRAQARASHGKGVGNPLQVRELLAVGDLTRGCHSARPAKRD
jgi:hypothetical protein